LTRTILAALEEDRFGDISAPVYVRGFLRIYAQFLELDADQLLEGYEQQIIVGGRLNQLEGDDADAMPLAQMPEYLRGSSRPSRALSPAQLFLLVATAAIVVAFMWNANRKRPVLLAARPGVHAAPVTAGNPLAPATAIGPTAPVPADARPVRSGSANHGQATRTDRR
jgi:cytoskeletal protein RodZ